jgi:hypothetical protein
MREGDMLWTIFLYFIILTLTLHILTYITCFTPVVMIMTICVSIPQRMITKWSEYTFYIFLSEFWPCVTLTLAAGTWILHAALRLTMVNICARLYWNTSMYVEVLQRTSVFQWTLNVTLTFDLEAWWLDICTTQLLIVVNISMKFL